MLYLSWVLFYFEVVSGLKVNLEKSVIFPVGNAVNIEMLARELGCRAWTLPSIYLGLPFGSKRDSSRVWEGASKIHKYVTAWKRLYISKRGRLTLVGRTISNMPIYTLSLFLMPKSVKNRLKKIQWAEGELERKTCLVN